MAWMENLCRIADRDEKSPVKVRFYAMHSCGFVL